MSTPAKDDPNVSRQALAKQFGVTPLTVDRWVREKHFPAPLKLGKARNSPTRWRQSTIDAWVAEQSPEVAQ